MSLDLGQCHGFWKNQNRDNKNSSSLNRKVGFMLELELRGAKDFLQRAIDHFSSSRPYHEYDGKFYFEADNAAYTVLTTALWRVKRDLKIVGIPLYPMCTRNQPHVCTVNGPCNGFPLAKPEPTKPASERINEIYQKLRVTLNPSLSPVEMETLAIKNYLYEFQLTVEAQAMRNFSSSKWEY